ncbi:TetR/AcrR family transcriptional regulator [Streptomyces sp. H27-S2]|uniref:TetR/AcrR family transcriptional regulator n=1 Tax=Streptomyces antarcticus TaxID=2996458 RepID=UPI002270B9CD|nr:TetR family transcriptional regulator [Streptomyces sp. H27-S2]MCY0954106.1 TetR family transcriptional regulator [Streptomyces sp. H27-S2]
MTDSGGRTAQPRRKRDPQRRIEEIISATERVITRRGIEGLTHRAVAEEAGVPLGATTYHFATREDLIRAALERSVDRFGAYLEQWVAQRPNLSPEQFAVLLTDALMGSFTADSRGQNTMEFELYLAALRRPELRAVADRHTQNNIRAISHYTDPVTAAAVAAASQGITLRGLANSQPPTRDEVESVLRRILTPNPALPPPPPQR